MAKGYWIVRINITDADAYKAYTSANGAVFEQFGARFVVRGGDAETRSGPEHQRHVVLEFDSYAQAKACHDSDAYQEIAKVRDTGADVDMVIVEGV
ncbi:MAG: DUF1330 domain-containing protein [Pseudomonadota bacterium]